MFRNMLKTTLCLALALLLAALPAAAETNVEERLSDLETLRAGLEQGHYDPFALVTPAEWEARVEAASVEAVLAAYDGAGAPRGGYVANIQGDLAVSANKRGVRVEPMAAFRARRKRG